MAISTQRFEGSLGRRAFILGAASAPFLRPVSTQADVAGKAPHVGVLMTTTPVVASHIVVAFTDALREQGRVDGQNIVLEYRWAQGRRDRLDELAVELVRRGVSVLVASSQAPALAAKRATSKIPIVMVNASDPVSAGLVASLARPGGNVTGLSEQLTPEIRAKHLQLLKEALPTMSRVTVLMSPSTTVTLDAYEAAGRQIGVRVSLVNVGSVDDIARALTAIGRDHGALIVPGDTFLFTERQRLVELARQHHVPGIYAFREYTEAGGLMSYSARLTELFRRAAVYVDKILRGADPATLPVEPPSQYEFVINLKTAKTLGVTVPQSLLLRADQLIE
jgi:putative tryptophan/tyrosine transport system substrate-binding protein